MDLYLWLVRHGQSTWNAEGRAQGWADPPLSELGRLQARQAAQRLADVPLLAIYSSTLQRAGETADIIGQEAAIVPVRDERLREHGLGEATGMTWSREAIFERWPHLRDVAARQGSVHAHVPGAESLRRFRARVKSVFYDIRQQHEEGNIAVVAHGGVFWVYLAHLMGANIGGPALHFDNASLSLVRYSADGHVSLMFVNESCHIREIHHTDS